MYFWNYLQFLILTSKSSSAKIVNIYFSTRKVVLLVKNTSKYCSQIILVHVHATGFFNVHPACHNIANSIKPGSDYKKTDKHAADC